MKNLKATEFFDLLDEHQLILFLALIQKQKRENLEPELTHMVGTHEQQTFTIYLHLPFEVAAEGYRFFSVDVIMWWDFEQAGFESRVIAAAEFKDKGEQALLLQSERLMYADANAE